MKLTAFSKTVLILTVLKGLFIVSLILSLILWSIPILSFNSAIWSEFQKRSGVVLDENVKNYNELVIDFFRNGLKLDFLNEKEFSHMQNVRNVINIVNILFAFSFVFLIAGFSYLAKSRKRFLLEATRKTSLIVFILTLTLSVIMLIDFNAAFFAFHKIFFVRNFIFPTDSILKTLYPDGFFYGLGAFYLISVVIVSLLVAVVSHRLKLK